MAAKRPGVVKGNTPGKLTNKRQVEGKSRRSLFSNETETTANINNASLLKNLNIGLVKKHRRLCSTSACIGKMRGAINGQWQKIKTFGTLVLSLLIEFASQLEQVCINCKNISYFFLY